MAWHVFAVRLIVALLFGALIGAERQWRQRMVGLRTNALVAAGAAMFVMMGGLIAGDGSQGRVAAYVVSGIGFLGGGVILKDGMSIRGLNTAATLWCTAAIGTLAGLRVTRFSLIGTLGIIGANVLLRPLGKAINRDTIVADAEITYLFRVTPGSKLKRLTSCSNSNGSLLGASNSRTSASSLETSSSGTVWI
jgi:putative Mg2+ transporter-C (MgtC) family protein